MSGNPLFGIARTAMGIKSGSDVAADADKWFLQAATAVLDRWSLDDARAFAETEDGGAITAVLDHLASGWKPRKEYGKTPDIRYTTVQKLAAEWMPDVSVRGMSDHAVTEMLKERVGGPPVPRGMTGTNAMEAIGKFRPLPGSAGRNVLHAITTGISRLFADFSLSEAKEFAALPGGDVLSSALDTMVSTPQLKQMGKRWGLQMGKTESHTKFARRLRDALDAPAEPTSEPAPTRRRGRRSAETSEPTPEPTPKKRGGRKAADHAWQPVEGKPGRRKRKLPSGRWHYEDVPLQKAGERRGAYLMRVLRWHLEQMKEFA